MSDANKPVFQISQQLFQQLVEWQEKLELEDELASNTESDRSTEVKNPSDNNEKHPEKPSQTGNS